MSSSTQEISAPRAPRLMRFRCSIQKPSRKQDMFIDIPVSTVVSSVLIRSEYHYVAFLSSLSSFARRSCSSISLRKKIRISEERGGKETLTWPPTDNQAYQMLDQKSQEVKGVNPYLTTRLPLQHQHSIWWEIQHVDRVILARNGTHGISDGNCPSLGLSLLCTTKIANFVRFDSRSDSGSNCSSVSISFCSSDRAYLWIVRGKMHP
jgi:hypothetical protein